MVNFPTTFDDDTTLYVAVNNLRTRLTASVNDSVTTIPVVDTTGFPSTGFISILSSEDITQTEAISYTGKTANSFTGAGRGAGGTTAVEHFVNDNVDLTIIAAHHNVLKDATIALQTFIGISGSENFLRVDDSGNVAISGTLVVAGTLTSSGVLIGVDDFDFRNDGAVSGTLTVGEIPVSTTQPIVEESEETVYVVTDVLSYADTGVETTALPTGHNLLLFRANAGEYSGTGYGSINLRCQFGGSTIGESKFANTDVQGGGHWNSTELCGFKMVTGDSVNTAKLQVDMDTSPPTSAGVGTQSLVSVPLQDMGLVQNTDYWFDNGLDTDTNITADSSWRTLTTLSATLPGAGDYLVFGYCEAYYASGIFGCRFEIDDSPISNALYRYDTVGGRYRPFTFCRLVTRGAGGSHDFQVKLIGFAGGNVIARRGRVVVIKASSFEQIIGQRYTGSITTSQSAFSEITQLTQTYTPLVQEQVLVIGHAAAGTGNTDSQATWKLRDKTNSVDYVVDSGDHITNTATDSIPSMFFALLNNVSVPTELAMYVREANSSGNQVEYDDGTLTIWGMSLATGAAIGHTTLQGVGIWTPAITATNATIVNDVAATSATISNLVTASGGAFSNTLTISGVPVATGTEASVPDPLSIGTINVATSLTVSGVPVWTADGGTTLTVREADGTPTVSDVDTIVVSNGTLTDDGGGQVTITTGGGGEGGVAGVTASGGRGAFLQTTSGVDLTTAASVEGSEMFWDEVVYDTDGFFNESTDNRRFVIPAGINKVRLIAGCLWDDAVDNTTGRRNWSIRERQPSRSLTTNRILATWSADAGDKGSAGNNPLSTALSSPVIEVQEGQEFTVTGWGENVTGNAIVEGNSGSIQQSTFFGIEVIDPASFSMDNIGAVSGTFSQSLTISGVPVATGTSTGSISFNGAIVSLTGSNVSIANATTTHIEWNNVVYDTGGFTTSSGNVLVIPAGVSRVRCKSQVYWDACGHTPGVGIRSSAIWKNYSRLLPSVTRQPAAPYTGTDKVFEQVSSYVISVSEGDQLSMPVYQNSGHSIDILVDALERNWFSIEVVE